MTTLADLANNERLRTVVHPMMDHWHDRLMSLGFVSVGLLLVVTALLGWHSWRRHLTRHQRTRPIATFLELARSLRLAWYDQIVLLFIARQQGLPSALTLLLSGATLRHHARRYTAGFGHLRRAAVMGRVAAIRRVLQADQATTVQAIHAP